MLKKPAPARLVSRSELGRLRRIWRRQRKRVIFTNGVFDILHVGHIELLDRAKSFGDILVIGLNSDASVRRLKGPSRPINSQRERAAVLMALRSVDCVCIFSEDTPFELIGLLRPDVLVKGAEYSVDKIVGADLLASWGGAVRRVRMKKGHSTSRVIRRASPRKQL
jgi:D-beta-D-heptose 7-phosphate kinase/D-beta-D-heptose 1-phosphate adenosyltransferase